MRPRLHPLLFAAILLLAAGLRFAGLSWGLRHTPDPDEQVFVENTAAMIRAGDLDHRFYEYPGLFFYILAPVLALLPREPLSSPQPYLMARGVVALFGVVGVGLAWRLASRMISPRAGLMAALLVAVSPVEVQTAHMVRPDVVLGAFALVTLLALLRVGEGLRGDLWAGAALGAATGIKFTGFLLVPSYFVRRALQPGARLKGAVAAMAAATAVGLAVTPYALIHLHAFLHGVSLQWRYHYHHGHGVAPRLGELSLYYLRTIAWNLGPAAVLLVFVGAWEARRAWRTWAPVVALPVVTLVVLCTAEARWIRLAIPALGALAIVAALGFEALAAALPRGAWAIAGLAAYFPLASSVVYVGQTLRPGTRDVVLDWVGPRLPAGARVLSGVEGIGIDRRQLEVLVPSGEPSRDRLLAQAADAILWLADGNPPPLEGRDADFVARSRSKIEGPSILVFLTPPERRNRLRPVPLGRATLTASSNPTSLRNAIDGDLGTVWATSEPGPREEWVDVELPVPSRIARVELLLGGRPARWGRRLGLWASDDGKAWRPISSLPCRPPVEEQVGRDEGKASQCVAMEPVLTKWLRITATPPPRKPWGFAEMRIDALDDDPRAAR